MKAVESTFSEEVRFGCLFTHKQKIIPCMKTTEVSAKDVIWRLSSKLSHRLPWQRSVSARRKVKLQTLIIWWCPVLRFPQFFPTRQLCLLSCWSHNGEQKLRVRRGPCWRCEPPLRARLEYLLWVGGRGRTVAFFPKGICHFTLHQSSGNKEPWDMLNLWYMLMYGWSTRFGEIF